MAGARYNLVTAATGNPWVAPAFPTPFTVNPDAAGLQVSTSIAVQNVRGVTVTVCGPAGEQAVSGTLEGWAQVPTNVLVNNAPEAATLRWVRCPKLDIQDVGAGRDILGTFDLTALGLVAFRIALLPTALVYSGGTTLSLVYSARYWGI